MIEVTVDSVRASLMSQHRVVVLREVTSSRYLPIWVDPGVAEAISTELQGATAPRPMTHDLLRNMLEVLGVQVEYVVVDDIRSDIFIATIVLKFDGKAITVDARPSDAIALAVRTHSTIYIEEEVMQRAALVPEPGIPLDAGGTGDSLAPYREFLESLDIDSLDSDKDKG